MAMAIMDSGNAYHGNGGNGGNNGMFTQCHSTSLCSKNCKLQPFLPATTSEKELHDNCTTMGNEQWQWQWTMDNGQWALIGQQRLRRMLVRCTKFMGLEGGGTTPKKECRRPNDNVPFSHIILCIFFTNRG